MPNNKQEIEINIQSEESVADEISLGLANMSLEDLARVHESVFNNAAFVRSGKIVSVSTDEIKVWFDEMVEEGRAHLFDDGATYHNPIVYLFDHKECATQFDSEQDAMRHAFETHFLPQLSL